MFLNKCAFYSIMEKIQFMEYVVERIESAIDEKVLPRLKGIVERRSIDGADVSDLGHLHRSIKNPIYSLLERNSPLIYAVERVADWGSPVSGYSHRLPGSYVLIWGCERKILLPMVSNNIGELEALNANGFDDIEGYIRVRNWADGESYNLVTADFKIISGVNHASGLTSYQGMKKVIPISVGDSIEEAVQNIIDTSLINLEKHKEHITTNREGWLLDRFPMSVH
jgi:hypothetical protein